MMSKMARNRSALHDVLAQGASNRDTTVCYVAPYLNQVFRRCFSMDNLRAYAEDDSASSPSTGQLAKRPPLSSEGLSTSSSSRTSSMAVPTTHVTSGPDPAVSAPTTSNPTVIQDKTVALEDIPPPPPAEPYEQFLARVSRELATLPGGPPRPATAAPPQPAVPIPTTGSRLPMPFPRYEDSSWASHQQAQMVRIRMPLPASCYAPPPSPWTWPGRGPAVPAPPVRGPAPLRSTPGPTSLLGPAALPLGPTTAGPTPALSPPSSSKNLKNTSPRQPRFREFFSGATPPFIPMALASSANVVAPPQLPQDTRNILQGPTPEMVRSWKTEWFEDMKLYLATTTRWRSTSVDWGSRCIPREHGPRRTAAAESLWRPRDVTGSA